MIAATKAYPYHKQAAQAEPSISISESELRTHAKGIASIPRNALHSELLSFLNFFLRSWTVVNTDKGKAFVNKRKLKKALRKTPLLDSNVGASRAERLQALIENSKSIHAVAQKVLERGFQAGMMKAGERDVLVNDDRSFVILSDTPLGKGSFKKIRKAAHVRFDENNALQLEAVAAAQVFRDRDSAFDEDDRAHAFQSDHIVSKSRYRFQDDEHCIMIYKLYEGDLYHASQNATFEQKLAWVTDAVRGLCELHAKDYVHGDFKGANIFLDGRHAVVGDLGTCAKQSEQANPNGSFICLPPEAWNGAKQDFPADLWAAGVLLHMLFEPENNEPPLSAIGLPALAKLTDEKIERDLFSVWTNPNKRDARMQELILKLMKVDPKDRLSAPELLAELEKMG